MTPQEQQLVADLFDRLASLEGEVRDPDAERVIRDGLGRAPNAVYALVQTVLVQDEALKRANAHIEELEKAVREPAQGGGGFLDSMRNALMGGPRDPSRGSVPSVRPGGHDKVDHPNRSGHHDDLANAIAGAVWRVTSSPAPLIITQTRSGAKSLICPGWMSSPSGMSR